MEDIDYPALIEEWKQNINATAYENIIQKYINLPSIKKKSIVMIKQNTGQNS